MKNGLRPVKGMIPLSTPGVYDISCSCGSVYIVETKRLIYTRVQEHIRHLKYEDIKISAVMEHSFKVKHAKDFDNTKVLAKLP